MVNTEIKLIIFFAAKDGEALYSQQKQDQELTVAQIMNSLLPNTPDTITTILCSSWYFPLPEINYKERKYSPNERESLVSLACHWILRIENTPWHKQEFRSYWLDEYHAVFEKNDIDVQMLKWKNVQDKLLSDRRKSQSIHTKWSHLCESECKHIM